MLTLHSPTGIPAPLHTDSGAVNLRKPDYVHTAAMLRRAIRTVGIPGPVVMLRPGTCTSRDRMCDCLSGTTAPLVALNGRRRWH